MCLRKHFCDSFERSEQKMESCVQKIRKLQQQWIAKMLLKYWAYHGEPRMNQLETILLVCLLMTTDHLCTLTPAQTLAALIPNTLQFVRDNYIVTFFAISLLSIAM